MTRRRFGCEFEFSATWNKVESAVRDVVPRCLLDVDQRWQKSEGGKRWLLKDDSTTSAELTTPACHEGELPFVCQVARRLSKHRLYITRHDGFHVHVSAWNNDPVKMALLWVDVEQGVLSLFPRHRRENHEYCMQYVMDGNWPNYGEVCNKIRKHHSVFSKSSFGTFEFRICEGTLDPVLIRAWVRFCLAFVSSASSVRPLGRPVSVEELLKRLGTPRKDFNLFMTRRERFV